MSEELNAFDRAYNELFRGRALNTQHINDCEKIWRAALTQRPAAQAVPMSHHDVVVMQFKLGPKFNDMTIGDLQMIVTAVEAHHGITQRADGGEKQA